MARGRGAASALLLAVAALRCLYVAAGAACPRGGATVGDQEGNPMKPKLQMKYSSFRKLLQDQQSNATANYPTGTTKVNYAALDPCKVQRLTSHKLYTIAVLNWPGGIVNEWLYPNNTVRNPCHDKEFSDTLARRDAFVSVFELRAPDLHLIRADINADEMIALLRATFLIKTTAIYNRYAISNPRVTASLDPNMSLESGYAAFLPIVIRGNLKVPSLFGEAIASVDFRVFDANTCSDCQRASEAKANLTMDFVANNTFFGEDAARILLERQDPESLKFSCINNVTCAWGLGWCSTCFQTRIEERAGVETYRDDLPGFLKEGQRGTQNIAEDDIRGVVQEMNVECQTVCTTTIQISFNGNDSWGQLLNSALMMVYTNGFDWIAKFQRYYGLPNTVIEDLTQIEAKNEENIVGSNQELEEEVS